MVGKLGSHWRTLGLQTSFVANIWSLKVFREAIVLLWEHLVFRWQPVKQQHENILTFIFITKHTFFFQTCFSSWHLAFQNVNSQTNRFSTHHSQQPPMSNRNPILHSGFGIEIEESNGFQSRNNSIWRQKWHQISGLFYRFVFANFWLYSICSGYFAGKNLRLFDSVWLCIVVLLSVKLSISKLLSLIFIRSEALSHIGIKSCKQ